LHKKERQSELLKNSSRKISFLSKPNPSQKPNPSPKANSRIKVGEVSMFEIPSASYTNDSKMNTPN
jgi:hypothetical protein